MTKRPFRAVAIGGPKYSGKDTACGALLELNPSRHMPTTPLGRFEFYREPMAGGLKACLTEMFGYPASLMEDPILKEQKTDYFPFIEPRWPMMDLGNWLRDKYGGDVHCQRWERITKELFATGGRPMCFVQPDLRFPEELEMHQRLGSLIVYVERASAEASLQRAKDNDDAMALNPSERHHLAIKEAAHVILQNEEGKPHVLRNGIQTAVRNHYGFWADWE